MDFTILFDCTISLNVLGRVTFEAEATDPTIPAIDASSRRFVIVQVSAENRPPQILRVDVTLDQSLLGDVVFFEWTVWTVTAIDPDGDPLSYEWNLVGPADECGTPPPLSGSPTEMWEHLDCDVPSEMLTTINIKVRDGRGGEDFHSQFAREGEGGTVYVEEEKGHPANLTHELRADIQNLDLPQEIEDGLVDQLTDVLDKLEDIDVGNDTDACNTLLDVLQDLEGLRGDELSDEEAADLKLKTQGIFVEVGC